MGYGRSRLKRIFLVISRIFFHPQQIFDEKKTVTTNLCFIKEISFRLYVCSSQKKNRYFICNNTTLTSQFFFPPLFVSILQKEKIIGKKTFLFVCQICVNKNQRPFQ